MSGLKGAPDDPTEVAKRRNRLDMEIQEMLAAKPATNKAAFNSALQARIDAEDAGVILPPPALAIAANVAELNAAAANREKQPAHLRNRTRKQSAVLEQLMAKMRVDAAREASAKQYTIIIQIMIDFLVWVSLRVDTMYVVRRQPELKKQLTSRVKENKNFMIDSLKDFKFLK